MFADDKSIENLPAIIFRVQKISGTPKRIHQTGINGKADYTPFHLIMV